MIELNFYKKYQTTWEELKEKALGIIDEYETEDNEVLKEGGELGEYVGEIILKDQYNDYRTALNMGLKTFILEVLNEWDDLDLLFINGEFFQIYKSFEIDGLLDNLPTDVCYRSYLELLNVFTEKKMAISNNDFDVIFDIFDKDTIVTLDSYDIKIIDMDEDDDEDDDL
jgi:hypothetical protein